MSSTSWSTLSHEVGTKHSTGRRPLRHQASSAMAFPATSPVLQGFSCAFQPLQEPSRHQVECRVARTNKNIDTLGQGMCSRQTLRDRTCLWTLDCILPTGSGALEHSQEVSAFLRLWMRTEGSFCVGSVPGHPPPASEGTSKAHTSPTPPRFESESLFHCSALFKVKS